MRRRAFVGLAVGAPLLGSSLLPLAARAQQAGLPARYERLILRFGPGDALLAPLRYEGNNMAMRGERLGRDAARPLVDAGLVVAERWQRASAACAQVFALRDTLFSQQDHPSDHRAHALLCAPSWVSVAVEEVRAGRALRGMSVPPLDDDAAWTTLETATLFGSFPPSEHLAGLARAPRGTDLDARQRTENARESLRSLAADVAAMVAAASSGPEAVAAAGAERNASSDRTYFGDARARVVPIYVENPNTREIEEEGKGMIPAGVTLDPESVRLARRAVYGARLAAGDMAIERFDIARADERSRVVSVLEDLVPRRGGAPGGTLWVWAHAGYDGHSSHGPDPLPHLARFRRALSRARIDRSRVRVLLRPSRELPRAGARAALEAFLDAYARVDLPVSIHLDTARLRALLAEPAPAAR